MNVVVSQSMYFPWVGLLEQIRLADIFVHYDDVQLARGFYNRVQVKTAQGQKWMTVPLRDRHQGQRIDEAWIDDRLDWRSQHRDLLRHAYLKAPFREDMLALVDRVFGERVTTLADLSRASVRALGDYFGVTAGKRFIMSRALGIEGKSSQRLLDIVVALGGTSYITGHGASRYLEHSIFEQAGVKVLYMQYQCIPYSQLHGEFTPYVTALDLVANCGRDGARVIQSGTVDWKEFTRSHNEQP